MNYDASSIVDEISTDCHCTSLLMLQCVTIIYLRLTGVSADRGQREYLLNL
jgi:hypothetical protein